MDKLAIAVILLSFACLVLCILVSGLVSKVNELQSKLYEKKPDPPKKRGFFPGDSVIIKDYPLIIGKGTPTEVSITCDYEAKVLEVSSNRLKVSAYDVTSSNSIAKSNKQSLIDFLQNYWVDIDRSELIMDQKQIREDKINEILS